MLCGLDHREDYIDAALRFFSRIGCPDEYSYYNVLVGLRKCNRIDTAMKLFEEMLDRNLVPTRTTDDFLNGELCKKFFKKMEKVRVKSI